MGNPRKRRYMRHLALTLECEEDFCLLACEDTCSKKAICCEEPECDHNSQPDLSAEDLTDPATNDAQLREDLLQELESLTVAQLREKADDLGLEYDPRSRKGELVTLLFLHETDELMEEDEETETSQELDAAVAAEIID